MFLLRNGINRFVIRQLLTNSGEAAAQRQANWVFVRAASLRRQALITGLDSVGASCASASCLSSSRFWMSAGNDDSAREFRLPIGFKNRWDGHLAAKL